MRQIENIIKTHMYYLDIPGLVVGFKHNSKPITLSAYGYADLEKMRLLKTTDVFHCASIAKLITATAVMQQIEKGRWSLDDPVMADLPDWRNKDPRFQQITFRHLLSHTSGLPDCVDYEWDHPRVDENALSDYVTRQASLHLLHPPGERFFYSNIGYDLLGYLLQLKTGKFFESHCREAILKPVEMKDSNLMKSMILKDRLVQPHIKNSDNIPRISRVFPYHRAHAPSSTLYATAHDLISFADTMMNTLDGTQKHVLQGKTLQEMLTPQAETSNDEQVGLGWFISEWHEQTGYGHEGHDLGFRTSLWMVPQQQISIVIMANIQTAATRKLMKKIYPLIIHQT